VKIQPSDLLVHFANILLLISYSVRSMLWLRWFAVASALTVVPYYVVQENVLWPPVFWAAVFTTINLYQIARLYAERRPLVLSADEQRLYDLAFRALRPRQFLSLTLIGEWKNGSAGDKVLTEGERVSAVSIATSGAIEVRRKGERLATLRPGQIVGTALALTDSPSPVSAAFTEAGRYMQWPVSQLRIFSDRDPELRTALQSLLNRDLAAKLESAASLIRPG
jgi:Popeye protein conserved region